MIRGKVQGVGFRYHTKRAADNFAISGTVENKYDGSVEIFAFGRQQNLVSFVRWCQKGPSYAYVRGFTSQEINYKDHQIFSIL